ncbi:hypothetical protein T492DRAFT_856263 [Pavlovales sp. CCMP2436]|nr:hypothetical protein T492DRAFT_856263 [Pavlovales sp. CCMP2436]
MSLSTLCAFASQDHGALLRPCGALWHALGHAQSGADDSEAEAPRPLRGRLRVSTRALFFETDDAAIPILRFPFAQLRALEPLDERWGEGVGVGAGSAGSVCAGVSGAGAGVGGAGALRLSSSLYAELHPDRPFAFRKGSWSPSAA